MIGWQLGWCLQAWDMIVATVAAGGVDPRLFEIMVNNTLNAVK